MRALVKRREHGRTVENTFSTSPTITITMMILLLLLLVSTCDFANPKWYSVIFGNATNKSYCSSYPAADDGPNRAQIE
jgi:hypothetical protein